ncbi:hypothetical protein C7999DRAFT_29499 [Corynascus novoguineensis]|uniref:Mediator of RNA polymerase II transcription subunit 9 n=1 Tax=Corynascus novoguineensis TaxID=1126955 RepID=A0AAN7CY01_9PEZI|nr:hypothetical protein C7999DRAFT_29499 [Corynascus novoguineensis]
MATHLPPGLSPDAVDVVTELSSIIARLRAAQQSASSGGPNVAPTTGAPAITGGKPIPSGATPIPHGGVTGTTPIPTSAPTPNLSSYNNTTNHTTANNNTTTTLATNVNANQQAITTGGSGATTATATASERELLLVSAKDLPPATDPLRHKLQRARAAVRTLGDVRRALAQQEAEAQALEERRQRQAARLARTQEDGLLFVKAKREESEGAAVAVVADMADVGGANAGDGAADKNGDGNGQDGNGDRMVIG